MDQDLAELALKLGWITPQQFIDALAEQARTAQALSDILVSKGYLSARQLDDLKSGRQAPTTRLDDSLHPHVPAEVRNALAQSDNDLGKFVLVSVIGRGGMGDVWKAWEKGLGRYVAIKFVRGGDQDDLRRFVREAQVVGRLSHPNFASVHEFGEHRGQPYFVMQYINGSTLDRAQLDLTELLKAIRRVAVALDFAHAQGIIHRDIKPANIMVEGNHVYVMDFGLARQTKVDSSISQSGMVFGTPQYMSPEQARGQMNRVDARSDVYSVGSTMYMLVTGKMPFELGSDQDVVALLERVANDDPTPPRKVKPDIPGEVETIILKAMEKDPSRRYQSAMELSEDIQRYLDGEPIQARRASFVYRLRKKLAKHRWTATATIAAALIGIGFGGYVLGSKLTAQNQKEAALIDADKAERENRWQDALGALERALAADPSDEALAARCRSAMNRAKQEVTGEKALRIASEFYREAERELHALRLLSYRPGWKLGEEEFALYRTIIERCEDQMKRSGESAAGWWVKGRAQQALGDGTSASESYAAGLKCEPDHPWCSLYRTRLVLERALFERFQKTPRRMTDVTVRMDRSDIEFDIAQGYEKVIRRDAGAVEYCVTMLRKWEGKHFAEEFYLLRGLAQSESLEKDASEAIRLRPGFYEAYFWRGIGRWDRGDTAGARDDLSRAIEIHPRYGQAWANRGTLNGEVADLSRAIEIDSRVSSWHHNRGNLRKNEADYTRAIELDPEYFESYYQRGFLRLQEKDPVSAIADLTRAIELRPDQADAWSLRGLARFSRGDRIGAESDYSRAIEINPRHEASYVYRGSLRQEAGEVEAAISDYSKAIDINPRSTLALTNRGAAHRVQGKLEAAYDDLSRVIDLDSKDAKARNNRGNVLRAQGKLKAAVEDYSKAIEIDPTFAEAHYNRGSVKSDQEDFAGAIHDLSRAIEAEPKFAQAYHNRAIARENQGDIAAALKDYDRAIELDPKDPKMYVNRGLAREAAADRNGPGRAEYLRAAVEDLEQALRLGGPQWEHRAMVEAALAQLRKKN